MSLLRSDDNKKWVFGFVAIVSLIVTFVSISFFAQMSEWFDLEAKIGNFTVVNQVVGILVGLATFITINKHPKSSSVLQEVYSELVKVVWPDRDGVTKLTIGIVIGLVVASAVFLVIDLNFGKILSLIY